MAREIQEINHNLLNIITPSGLEFSKTKLLMGEMYSKCITLIQYPTNPDYGWLAKITQLEGVTSSIHFQPTESGTIVRRCNEEIKQLLGDLSSSVRDESVRQTKEKAVEDIKSMIQRINGNNEIIGYMSIVLMISATNEKALEERVKRVSSIIIGFGGVPRNLTLKQKAALEFVAPYGTTNEKIFDMCARNMPISTFLGGFINESSGFNDGTGLLIGKSDSGKPIILNIRLRGGDRTNSNWIITGVPGVGKSATVKKLIFYEYALGAKIVILDPEKEYIDIVRALGGKVIDCGGGIEGRINPLQIRSVPQKEEEIESDEEEIFKAEGNEINELALHLQSLRIFLKLYQDFTDLQMSKLEEIIERTYLRFHITWDTKCSELKPNDYPIFSDVYADILEEQKKHLDDPVLDDLAALMRSISIGADSYIFNGYTTLSVDTDIVDLDISKLLECDDNILRAQFHNINSYVWQLATKDRNENVIYVIDEGYLIIDTKNPEGLIFVKNYSKRIRKYGGGLMFITHSLVDLLDPEIKRHGQAIIDGACYKFIMGTDGKNLEEMKQLFNLTEAEESLLLSKQRGRGLLYAGSGRINCRVEIPQSLMLLMGTSGGK